MTTMAQIATGSTGTAQLHATALRLRQIMSELNQQFQERSAVIEALVIGLLTNQHVFILGPPGTAKSLLCRSLIGRIVGGRYFEKAMAGDTPWEALAGPIDIVRLTEDRVFARRTTGTLLDSDWVMIDEIARANGLVSDNLLPILNERVYHEVDPDTGESVRNVPLRCAFGGSNALPTDENEGAAAFYDRMPIRTTVDHIQEVENFISMISNAGQAVPNPTTITRDEMIEAADVLVPAVTIPRDVLTAVATLRDELRAKQIVPSGRRWVQAMAFVRANAFLNGRTEATTEDLGVLRYTLWDLPEHEREVARLTTTVSNPMGEAINTIADRIEEVLREHRRLDANTGMAKDEKAKEQAQLVGNCNVVSTEIDQALQKAKTNGYSTRELDDLNIRLAQTKQTILDAALATMNGS